MINFNFESDKILRPIKLQIASGQKIGLIGANGAGKSSLLATIIGVSNIKTTGKINFKNKNLFELSIAERAKHGVGLICQKPPTLNGVSLIKILNAIEPNQTKIKKVIRILKIEKLLKRNLNQDYSGGEMRRAELAQVILQNPDLVLIDEIDSGVDLDSRKIIYQVLADFLADKTAIMVSHDFELYDKIKIDNLLIMKNGQIKMTKQPYQFLTQIKTNGYEGYHEF